MTARIDLAGERFGRWTALSYAGDRRWLCRCDCGIEKAVDGSSLRSGATQGCINCHPALGKNRVHGESKKSGLYTSWRAMKARCLNPNEPAYPGYGGRGITICAEWADSFEAFQAWALANGYQAGLTIERRDNDGNYDPGNCCWIPLADQKMNRRNTVKVTWNGREMTLLDVSRESGVSYDLLKQRVRKYGWTVERAVSEPSRAPGRRK